MLSAASQVGCSPAYRNVLESRPLPKLATSRRYDVKRADRGSADKQLQSALCHCAVFRGWLAIARAVAEPELMAVDRMQEPVCTVCQRT